MKLYYVSLIVLFNMCCFSCDAFGGRCRSRQGIYCVRHETKVENEDSWLYDNSASLIGSVITAVGFLIALYQLRKNNKTLQAELALKLDDKAGYHRGLYQNFFEGGEYYETIPCQITEKVEYYLTFYDTISLLVRNKQITLKQINSLYGYRFICLMHNSAVQDIVRKRIRSWEGLLWLYERVMNLRTRNEQEIDRPQNEFKYRK